MTSNEYYSLKRGDIVKFSDTGSNCIVIHFDTTDYPKSSEPRQEPNKDENLCVIFIEDDYRVIGHRKEFEIFSQKTLNKTNNAIV